MRSCVQGQSECGADGASRGGRGRRARDPFSALHVACRENHASIVRILLDAGADVYAVGGMDEGIWDAMRADGTIQYDEEFMPQTPLVTGIEAGAVEAIHELFRNRSRPCLPDYCWAILHHACNKGFYLPALPALLSHCTGPSPFIDVKEMGNEYGKALRTAIRRRLVEAVKLLLEIPHTDIWVIDWDESAWSLAIADSTDGEKACSEATRLQILRLLRDAMATRPWPWTDTEQSDDDIPGGCASFRRGCLSACFEAIDRKQLAVVRLMLQVDPALLNSEIGVSEDRASRTLLIYAICMGDLAFARELALMPGCDVNLLPRDVWRNGRTDTALEECCRRATEGKKGYVDMVKFLCGLPGISICRAAKQLRGVKVAGSAARGAVAPTGAGTSAVDAQQRGKKKRKREG